MFNAFLKIDGIDGESEDKGHEKWIQLLSFSHKVRQPGTNIGGGGARSSSGAVEHGDFTFTKYVDAATPLLFLRACDSNNIKKVTLEVCRQVDTKLAYLVYTFEPCLISGVSIGGNAVPETSPSGNIISQDRPIETVTFNYTKIEWKYTQVSKDNTAGGAVVAAWDLATNDK